MHPTLIFSLSLLGLCTATFFGGESKSLPVHPPSTPSHPHVIEHEHVHVQPSPKIIKVILKSDHSHDHSHDHGHGHGHDSGHTKIIKIIHENSGRSNEHGHDDHGHGESHGHGSHGSDSKFLSILPQILQIVLADEGRSHSHGHDHGHGGSFFSTVSKGADFYKGGHVIEKGELKLKKIPNNKNYDDESSDGGFDKASLLSSLFAKKPSSGPSGWSSSGSSGWSSAPSGWSSSGSSGWSSAPSGWSY